MWENSTSKIFRSSVKKNNNLCLNFNDLSINRKLSGILTISGSPNSLHLIVTDVIKVCGPPKEPWYFTFLSLLASNSYAPGLSWKYWKSCYKTMPMLRPSATLCFVCLTFFYVWLPRCHIVKQFSHLAPVYFFNLYIGLWEIFGLNWNITLNLPLMSMHAFSLESCNHTPKSSTWTSLGIRLYNLYAGYNALKLSWEAKHPAPQSTLKIKPSTV